MQRLSQVFGWEDFPRPLFYECDFALRFELGGDHEMGPNRLLQAMDRARAIASRAFAETETLTVVVPFYSRRTKAAAPSALIKDLKNLKIFGEGGAMKRMAPRDADDAETVAEGWHRFLFSFDVDNSPAQISSLIWAAVINEMDIRPRFSAIASNYILDFERGVAMHIYDDRGMDLVAIRPSLLQPCYESFRGYLLDHDRVRMAATFATDPLIVR